MAVKGIMLIATMVGIALLLIWVVPSTFFYTQNDIDTNIVVTGTDAGAFEFVKSQGHMLAIWIGNISPMTGLLFLAFAVLLIILFLFFIARRNSA